jgi:hypothetical protein
MDFIEKNIDDILDSKGIYNNFLNNNTYSDTYRTVASYWSKLPIYNKIHVKKFFDL